MAYTSGALRFRDESINLALDSEIEAAETKKKVEAEECQKNKETALAERNRIAETAEALYREERRRKRYFGPDYVFEEFETFKRENKQKITVYLGADWWNTKSYYSPLKQWARSAFRNSNYWLYN